MKYILTLNCGSSSIKAKLFSMPDEHLVVKLNIADVGLKRGSWVWKCGRHEESGREAFPNYDKGIRFIMDKFLRGPHSPLESAKDIGAVAHRVVHGGPKYKDSTKITASVIAGIKANTKLAPLHTPPNLKGIQVAKSIMPRVPHIAVFDTGFHQTIPDYAAAYPLPYRFFEKEGIRRYGFHGISYRYVMGEAATMMKRPLSKLKLIVCHLGSGCSVCAIEGGKSKDTSMGFTPVEGIMMRTRCGDVDPGVMLHLMNAYGYTPTQLNRLINHRSGLLGISDGASTMPEVIERMHAGDKKAKLAFEMFCYRVEQYIGSYVATLGGIDGLVFTGGIGENQPDVRDQIVKWCKGFGLKIDKRKNRRAMGVAAAVHNHHSHADVMVIPTNEGLMMARDAFGIIGR